MLFVIAIVGGAIFTTVQNSAQIQSVSGLNNADVQVEDYGLTNNGLELELRAATAEQVKLERFSIIDSSEDGSERYTNSEVIPVGDTQTINLSDVETSDTSEEYELEIVYDTGGLDGLTTEGTITGSFDFPNLDELVVKWTKNIPGSTGNIGIDSNYNYYSGSYTTNMTKSYQNGTEAFGVPIDHPIFDIETDKQGYVYVASRDSPRVQKISTEGNYEWNYTGHTDRVFGLAVDENQNVYSSGDDTTVKK